MSWKLPHPHLRTRIFLLVGCTVLLALLVTGALVSWRMERRARENLAEKARVVAVLVAGDPRVAQALEGGSSPAPVQALADQARQAAGVDYIVVLTMEGIRMTHPNPALIGDRFKGGDNRAAYCGCTYVSQAEGTLGPALRVFAPVRDREGRQVGAVAVGVLMAGVAHQRSALRRMVLAGMLVGCVAGAFGAAAVAGRVKAILLGMEPLEIATLLQERTAILQSVREGVLAVDRDMRVTVVNEEARRLFLRAGAPEVPVEGARLASESLGRVMATGTPEFDQERDLDGLPILSNRVPVTVRGTVVGAVTTFRDKSEVHRLAEQLTGVRLFADALRAQTHEFMNKLHVILGLARLGEQERLVSYVQEVGGRFQGEVGEVAGAVKDPVVAGFLLARFSAAREKGITMVLAEGARVPVLSPPAVAHHVVTILGNFLENAADALEGAPRREIRLALGADSGQLVLAVEDTGPGLPPEDLERIFQRGFSTKGAGRGHGLANALRSAEALGGSLEARNIPGGGARFQATLPHPAEECPS